MANDSEQLLLKIVENTGQISPAMLAGILDQLTATLRVMLANFPRFEPGQPFPLAIELIKLHAEVSRGVRDGSENEQMHDAGRAIVSLAMVGELKEFQVLTEKPASKHSDADHPG